MTQRLAPARVLAATLILAALVPALAQARPPGAPASAQHAEIAERVLRHVEAQTANLPGKVQVTVRPLDERTRVGACDDMQVFTAPGARLWGQSSVGVRCVRPQPWQVFVPVTVRVSGEVVVANRPLAAGTVLEAADVSVRNEELTTAPASIVLDPSNAIGRTLATGIAAGAALRAESFKVVLAVVQGQTVRVIYESSTISVTTEGRALGNAAIGQPVEVRVGTGGKTVRGVARDTGVVVVR